ncbi:MAG: hypothetical protein ABIO88_13340, partial [Burkholderiaceae bacterium]
TKAAKSGQAAQNRSKARCLLGELQLLVRVLRRVFCGLAGFGGLAITLESKSPNFSFKLAPSRRIYCLDCY